MKYNTNNSFITDAYFEAENGTKNLKILQNIDLFYLFSKFYCLHFCLKNEIKDRVHYFIIFTIILISL